MCAVSFGNHSQTNISNRNAVQLTSEEYLSFLPANGLSHILMYTHIDFVCFLFPFFFYTFCNKKRPMPNIWCENFRMCGKINGDIDFKYLEHYESFNKFASSDQCIILNRCIHLNLLCYSHILDRVGRNSFSCVDVEHNDSGLYVNAHFTSTFCQLKMEKKNGKSIIRKKCWVELSWV